MPDGEAFERNRVRLYRSMKRLMRVAGSCALREESRLIARRASRPNQRTTFSAGGVGRREVHVAAWGLANQARNPGCLWVA